MNAGAVKRVFADSNGTMLVIAFQSECDSKSAPDGTGTAERRISRHVQDPQPTLAERPTIKLAELDNSTIGCHARANESLNDSHASRTTSGAGCIRATQNDRLRPINRSQRHQDAVGQFVAQRIEAERRFRYPSSGTVGLYVRRAAVPQHGSR